MIARFFQQLLNSFGVVFRTFRAFFTRQIMGVRARARRITSFSRHAAKLVPKAMSAVAVAGKKPTKREDFVETKRLFVAKSFLVLLAVGLVAVGLLAYFVVWPWLVSMFFTARLYQEEKAVAAYNGKVIVFYDAEKEEPMLQGRMEEGLLQGKGKAFDEAGRVLYEGGFVDGLYEGKGSLYAEGVLAYEGAFAGGLQNGEGTAYAEGAVCYKGGFVDGLYEGQGTAYYPDGGVAYQGGFLGGLYSGQGTLYSPDGAWLYEGGFLQGAYSGEGKLRLSPELRLSGVFEEGEPVGDVAIHWSNRLYYEGEVEDLAPHGQGTLYASTGEAIYRGAMAKGAPDLGALLNKTGDEARAAFADAALVETEGERNGFSINNAALGVTLFCTYKTEEMDPTVYYVYGYDKGADPFADAMPWRSAAAYEAQAGEGYEKRETVEKAVFTGGVPYPSGEYLRTAYYYADYVFVGWSRPGEAEWLMVEWIVDQSLPEAGAGEVADGTSAGRLDSLLGKLGLAEEPAGAPAGAASKSAYYGQEPPEALVNAAGADLESALSTMADFYLQAETREALEEQARRKGELLAAEEKKLAMGTGSQEAVDALAAQVGKLELAASRAAVAMEKTQLAAEGWNLADYDMTAGLFLQDPAALDVDALKAAGEEKAVQLALLDLELAWQELQQAQKDYGDASEKAAATQKDYAMGNADEAARCDALCAQSEAAVRLHEGIYACVRQMIGLNALTHGYLAEEYGWLEALQPQQ